MQLGRCISSLPVDRAPASIAHGQVGVLYHCITVVAGVPVSGETIIDGGRWGIDDGTRCLARRLGGRSNHSPDLCGRQVVDWFLPNTQRSLCLAFRFKG